MPPIQHSILPAVMEYLTAKRKGKDALAEVAITAGEEGFDFACRRPMDLVLAETYAREMQIEAAKVKVRGTPENRARDAITDKVGALPYGCVARSPVTAGGSDSASSSRVSASTVRSFTKRDSKV